jgi:hypothetical protein
MNSETLVISYAAILDQQTMAPIISIGTGALLAIAGIKCREKTSFFSGNIWVIGFLFYWECAVNLYSRAPWLSSIALGLGIILLASYLKNKEKVIMANHVTFLMS